MANEPSGTSTPAFFDPHQRATVAKLYARWEELEAKRGG